MSRLGLRYQAQRQVDWYDQATADRNDRWKNVRRLLLVALSGAVCGLFTGVIWAAYQEFGNQSLLHRTPLVAADPRPLKLLPEDRTADDVAVARRPAGQGSRAAALAEAARPAAPIGETRPATARRSDAEQESEIDPPAVIERPAVAPYETEPDVAVDPPPSAERSVATAPEMPLDVRPAASLEPVASAVSDAAPPSGPATTSAPVATSPPAPAFKPLEVVPTVVAEAPPAPAALAAPEGSRRGASPIRPPRPTLKPVIMLSETSPEPVGEREARTVAATPQTLPEALRALWTNLKILLASAPASSDVHVGGDGSDGNDGGGASTSSSGRSTSGGGSTSSDGSASSGGGTSTGSGSNSTSDSGGGSAASSGGGGSSASGGGNSGRGRDNGDRGGRGGGRGGDDDDDGGGRGGGRGGDDDDDGGGRGGGRGGDDDDDD